MDRRTFTKLAGLAGAALVAHPHESLFAKAAAPVSRYKLWSDYLVGAAYYPEWWPLAEWETDFGQMQQLGINAARMGEFAWARFEPAPGKFEFAWMDEAIEIASRHGVRAVLATPTASVPPWLYQQYPEVLSGNQTGPYTYGGRKGYNTNSPHYLEASARITTALAEHYGNNGGVIGWQLDNEPGYPFQQYDPVTEKAFQGWLEKRYGTIDALNKAWNGAFWSNTFTAWSEIKIPSNSAEGGWQPAISLDYRRFFSDSFLNHLRRQANILHAHIKEQFVFTNWPAPTWSVDVYQAASEFLDATAWDNYVSAPGLSRYQRQYIAAFLSDFCRCAGPHQRFLCAEQNAYVPPNADPEGLRLQAYSDLAHGAHGQLYFEWRRPLAGNEEHRPSFIKGFDGRINPDQPVLAQICKEMAWIGPKLADATTTSDIAVLYSFPNEWAQGMGGIGDPHPRYGECGAFYNGLKALHRNIDVVPPGIDLSGYKIVVASNLRLIDDATIDKLKAYVAAGGTLVLNYRAATQNMDNSMRRALSPGAFAEIAGVQSDAMLDLFEYNSEHGLLESKLQNELGIQFTGSDAVYHPATIVESLHLTGAEVLATLVGAGRMTGKPAVTRHRSGKGWVFYVGVDSNDSDFYDVIARAIAGTIDIKPIVDAPRDVEVITRSDGKTAYVFLLNMAETDHGEIALPQAMDDVLGGQSAIEKIALGPLAVAVLSHPA